MYLDNVQKYKNNQVAFQPTRDSRPNALLVDLLSKERVGVTPTQGMMNVAQMETARRQSGQASAAA